MRDKGKRICFVVATEITISAFLIDQIRGAAAHHYVYLALNTDDPQLPARLGIDARVAAVRIERKIKPLRDIAALVALVRLFRAQRFDLVHSVSPKAGLLAMMAGFVTSVPCRVHTFTGQVWATKRGVARLVLKCADKLVAALATDVLIDSPSQQAFLIEQGIVGSAKSQVLAHGSISGVDIERFRPDLGSRVGLRRELGIPEDAVLFLYLGRINRDKGLLDLAAAYAQVSGECHKAWLALVGPDEERLLPELYALAGPGALRLTVVGYTNVPERYMAAADVFCLPSNREGFGTVVIEAAACGVPAIGSRIYGVTDAIIDGVTGLLHDAGDRAALGAAMRRLAMDAELRTRLAHAARARARAEFPMAALTSALLAFYAKILY